MGNDLKSPNRKEFIKLSAGAGASLLLGGFMSACSSTGEKSNPTPAGSSIPFGIQLWSVKEDMAADAKGTLTNLGSYGYTQIESFDGEQGIFWGMKPTEFKKFLSDNGLTLKASHVDFRTDFEKKLEGAAEAGAQYLIAPWLGPQESIDDFRRYAEQFNKLGEACKSRGLKFAYHNHDYSFFELDGEIPQRVMMDETQPDLVDFEMDIYWVVTAGEDPVKWMKEYKNRFTLSHVKDRKTGATPEEKFASVQLGTGSIDYGRVLSEAQATGMQYFFVEQEAFEGTTPMESAKANAEYMKKLRI